MVDDRDDKSEFPDDGEYHFSDDQVNYDAEPEVVKISTPDTKGGAAVVTGISQYRRPLIGLVIFGVLIFLVYKLLAPASTIPTTDFNTSVTQAPAPKAISRVRPSPSVQAVPTTQPSTPVAQPAASTTMPSVAQPQAQSNAPAETPNFAASAPPAQSLESSLGNPPAFANAPAQAEPAASEANYDTASTSSVEKLLLLQQQNTKLIAQVQTDTAQRIAAYQSQVGEMDNKIQALSAEISKIESTLSDVSKAMQDLKTRGMGSSAGFVSTPPGLSAPAGTVMEPPPNMPVRVMPSSRNVPHLNYTVQAIIPGRAWLKSDAGETITVAEGDSIRGGGRIMKIDPYNGVVEIDMHGHILSLSYGSNGD